MDGSPAPRVVVTGARGFLGRALCAHVRAAGFRVLGLGRSAPLDADQGAYRQIDLGDVQGLRACLGDFRPTVIVHAAGAPHHASLTRQFADNVAATASLMRANRMLDQPARVVLVSSASVYGDAGCHPWAEGLLPAPFSAYGRSKAAAEQIAVAARGACEIVVARVFNLCGPGQDAHHVCGALARRVVAVRRGATRLLAMGPGHPVRDFIDVRDAADALLHLAMAPAPDPVVNVGSGQGTAVIEVAASLIELAGLPPSTPVEVADSAAGVAHAVADVRVLYRLGWRPQRCLRESLADLLHELLVAG